MIVIILLVVVALSLLGALPLWPYSRKWGIYPSAGIGLLLLVIVTLHLLNVI